MFSSPTTPSHLGFVFLRLIKEVHQMKRMNLRFLRPTTLIIVAQYLQSCLLSCRSSLKQLNPFFLFSFTNSALQLLSFCSASNSFPTVGLTFFELKRIWPVNRQPNTYQRVKGFFSNKNLNLTHMKHRTKDINIFAKGENLIL